MKRDKLFLTQINAHGIDIKFDKKTDWMQEILNGLHEQLEDSEVKVISEKESIEFEGTLSRKMGTQYGDYALLKGNVSAEFFTHCIVTGEIMKDQVHAEVKATFIEEEYGKKFDLEEETTLYLDDDEYELYYLENNKLDVSKVINEMVFLNKNQYPKKIQE